MESWFFCLSTAVKVGYAGTGAARVVYGSERGMCGMNSNECSEMRSLRSTGGVSLKDIFRKRDVRVIWVERKLVNRTQKLKWNRVEHVARLQNHRRTKKSRQGETHQASTAREDLTRAGKMTSKDNGSKLATELKPKLSGERTAAENEDGNRRGGGCLKSRTSERADADVKAAERW
ncbi:hypothetical protein EVAR_40154_1 [Eumeta japonica]|uniref:Uncharacterized protein n=1 Tax=Eumeta variegata TaxID=151549 RepID=A0A4C1YH57_EUMVA|nr:hypothetical protein EVAR_40154_1 [Eumeta japonica]